MRLDVDLAPPSVPEQLERLARLGLVNADDPAARALPDVPEVLVALRHDRAPAAELAELLQHAGKPGFVVEDMTDLDAFVPTPDIPVPDAPLYLVAGLARGDELRSWSPAEALPHLQARGRSPLTLHEGLSWALQRPDVLQDNHCFMTVGSRKPNRRGYDARTPAIWISRGTGRDGKERRDAPKVGWCWWNNRHSWLGFASCTGRTAGA